MPHTRILTALLMAVLPALQCHASEKDELALVMRQLDQCAGRAGPRPRGGEPDPGCPLLLRLSAGDARYHHHEAGDLNLS